MNRPGRVSEGGDCDRARYFAAGAPEQRKRSGGPGRRSFAPAFSWVRPTERTRVRELVTRRRFSEREKPLHRRRRTTSSTSSVFARVVRLMALKWISIAFDYDASQLARSSPRASGCACVRGPENAGPAGHYCLRFGRRLEIAQFRHQAPPDRRKPARKMRTPIVEWRGLRRDHDPAFSRSRPMLTVWSLILDGNTRVRRADDGRECHALSYERAVFRSATAAIRSK